jgi:hypothetical protein
LCALHGEGALRDQRGDFRRNAETARHEIRLQSERGKRKFQIDHRAKLINPGGPHLRHPDDGGPLRF